MQGREQSAIDKQTKAAAKFWQLSIAFLSTATKHSASAEPERRNPEENSRERSFLFLNLPKGEWMRTQRH
jgi:hypothetical protein